MKLHREGYQIIASFGIALFILNFLIFKSYEINFIRWIIFLASLVLIGLVIWFFRVPMRIPGSDNEMDILSPADGKVVAIETIQEEEYFHDERIQISVFMSPLNVHQNTYPVEGSIVYRRYHPGKYLVAWHPKSSDENERSTLVIKTKSGHEILIRQIAGAVARRIKTYGFPGDAISAGEELGFIKFGSRVDILLPLNSEIKTEIGNKTKSKISVLASVKNANSPK